MPLPNCNTGEVVPVEGKLNCSSKNFIYLLWSVKDPSKQYCGSSGREVRRRCGEHRRDIENDLVTKAVPNHFHTIGSGVKDLVFVPFKKIFSSDPAVRLHFEREAINKFNLLDEGVNRKLA